MRRAQRDATRVENGWTRPDRRQLEPSWSISNQPVVNVSWLEARAFARWLADKLGMQIALPTVAEWIRATAGPHGYRYPWGNEWEAHRCNCSVDPETAIGSACAVGLYPLCASPFGVMDMAGNVRELTDNIEWIEAGSSAIDAVHLPYLMGGDWGSTNPDEMEIKPPTRFYHKRQSLSAEDGNIAVGFRLVSFSATVSRKQW